MTIEFFKTSASRMSFAAAADVMILLAGGMNQHVQRRYSRSCELRQKKNVWLCANFELVLIEKISDL